MDRETADEISRRFNVVGEELRTEIRTVRRHFDVVGEELRSQIRNQLAREDILAALAYAARALSEEQVRAVR